MPDIDDSLICQLSRNPVFFKRPVHGCVLIPMQSRYTNCKGEKNLMRMQTFSGALLLVFQFACCFSIPVDDFIGYPFNRCLPNYGILAPADDDFVSVGLSKDLVMNGERFSTVHVRLHFMLDSCEIQCFWFINHFVCLHIIFPLIVHMYTYAMQLKITAEHLLFCNTHVLFMK